jgi:hypothetical protein
MIPFVGFESARDRPWLGPKPLSTDGAIRVTFTDEAIRGSKLGDSFDLLPFDEFVRKDEIDELYLIRRSPHKEFLRSEGYHHFFVFNRPDDFLGELVSRVRPLV